MAYGWKITADHIGTDSVGTMGPSDITADNRALLDAGRGVTFQMFDDDGEKYYTGKIVGDDVTGFEPLDDFGTGNAGCTGIKYPNATSGVFEYL